MSAPTWPDNMPVFLPEVGLPVISAGGHYTITAIDRTQPGGQRVCLDGKDWRPTKAVRADLDTAIGFGAALRALRRLALHYAAIDFHPMQAWDEIGRRDIVRIAELIEELGHRHMDGETTDADRNRLAHAMARWMVS